MKDLKSTVKDSKAYEYQEPFEVPPPSYPTIQNGTPSQPASSAPSNAVYPPGAHHTRVPSRTLNIEYEGWKGTRAHILSEDNRTRLYNIKLCCFTKPNMKITAASDPSPSSKAKDDEETIGTVNFHVLSSRIDTTIRSKDVEMTTRGRLKYGYRFSSATLGDLQWKMQSHKLDLVCVDAKGVAWARFVFANWSLKKCGRFEMFGSVGEETMEEFLVTGLAFVNYTIHYVIAVT